MLRSLSPWSLVLGGALALAGIGAPSGWAAEPEPAAAPSTPDDADWGDEGEGADEGWGEGGTDAGDGFDGFGDEPLGDDTDADENDQAWSLSMSGNFRAGWALWLERLETDPLAKARHSLDVDIRFRLDWFRIVAQAHFEYDFAWAFDQEKKDGPSVDAYWWLLDTRELYAAASIGPVELSFGRQIVPWGAGEMLSPADVINPRDNREPGLADIQDLRLPVLATRVGLFLDEHRLELMAVHEADWGYRSPPLGPMSPFGALMDDTARALTAGRRVDWTDTPDRFSLESQQVYLRYTYNGPGLDIGIYGASTLDKQGVFGLPDNDTILALLTDPTMPLNLPTEHLRYWMVGTSGVVPTGDWLFRWEVAASLDRAVNTGAPGAFTSIGQERTNLLDVMAGVTWGGIPNTQIGLEIQKGFFLGDRPQVMLPTDALAVGLRFSTRQLRELLDVQAALLAITWLDGDAVNGAWLFRAEINYIVMDGMKIGLGFVTYQPGEGLSPLAGLDTHDRVFFKWRYDFVLP